jgi:hypothetical protein
MTTIACNASGGLPKPYSCLAGSKRKREEPVADAKETAASLLIYNFLRKKVHSSRAYEEYRKHLLQKSIEIDPHRERFQIVKISPEHYTDVINLVSKWKKEVAALSTHPEKTFEDAEKLERLLLILSYLAKFLQDKNRPTYAKLYKSAFLLIARDSKGVPQAVATVTRPFAQGLEISKEYVIDYLVTAPGNLRLSYQDHCVRGAATAMIEDIVYRTLRNTRRKEVSLIAAPNAIPFYKKLGFCMGKDSQQFYLHGASVHRFLKKFAGLSLP